jgi:hypothetical protein
MVTPDGCNCYSLYTTPIPNFTDLFTGEVGVACLLNKEGLDDLNSGNSDIINLYNNLRQIGGGAFCYSEDF